MPKVSIAFLIRLFLPLIALTTFPVMAAELRTPLSQPVNTWVKRSPLPDGPVSPRLGYEGACVWDVSVRFTQGDV